MYSLFIQNSTQLEQQWLHMWNSVRNGSVWWTTTLKSKVTFYFDLHHTNNLSSFITTHHHWSTCRGRNPFLTKNESELSCMCFSFFALTVLSPLLYFLSEVRCQLVDQLKVLDLQLEQKSQQLQDLSDYLRRRGEIESEYARSLEKLTERFTSRIKR